MQAFASCGIHEVHIVRGYRGEMIQPRRDREYWNYEYDRSNMIASLFCADEELNEEVIISYADVVFERRILAAMLNAPPSDILVPIDVAWERYYMKRFSSL